ncbi:MAG: single-stranded DNA-binding protein [Schleiferiaceae bacterium]|jgi:single-strand DNA-binding protein|nr:single-stranded DNA-binding protein [Schleiferiaceae bacterium]MDR9441632.1 single-stranded DNA-binding protein [Schleiferiaceae bacterium]
MADRSLNKVTLIGNLGKDPEMKVFEGGGRIARFPLATSESYTNRNGEQIERTEWHNVVLNKGLADVGEKYLKKGDKVYVEGQIRTRSWEDRETQQQRYITEIVGLQMIMLGSPQGASSPAGGSDQAAQTPGAAPSPGSAPTAAPAGQPHDPPPDMSKSQDDDDLPF